jgi:mono/diheme cytochrome c family protein
MTARYLNVVAGAAALALLAACSSPRKSEPLGPPVELSPAQTNGRLLFDRLCYKCHTQGEGGLAPSLNDKPLRPFMIRFQTRRGLGAMPAFPPTRLSEEDLDDIVDYLIALRHHQG